MRKFIAILICAAAMLSACAAPESESPVNNNVEQNDVQGFDGEEYVEEPEKIIEEVRNLTAVFYHQNRPYYYADDHLEVSFDEVETVDGYEVEISKEENFEDTKIYELKRNRLFIYAGKDDEFIPGCINGYYVRARVKGGAWSEAVTIGCNVLHFN